ncbi:MAG: 3-hydroxy-5-phosphonooxypentane-2,4-dione thiolase [Deltaproteobacteria bacterium]|nr:3-hydroxy-5-phosphonooxypentane-2,4-dione thiolase [Deltaproteobacteria bacterium]
MVLTTVTVPRPYTYSTGLALPSVAANLFTKEDATIMDWGMQNRLARIIKPEDGRAVMLAVDHGYFLGPTSGLEEPRKTIEPLLPYADSIMLTRGVLRTSVDARWDRPVVLRVSGGTSILKELSNEDITVSIEDAIRVNASALALSIFVGGEFEKETLVNLAKLVDEGERCGIPVLAVTAVGKEMARDARYLGLSCRIAAELGAHVVKTYYCEDFESVVQSCPIPVIIAGGKKTPEMEALELTFNAVKHGAVGVDMGRNIFQSDCPVGMIRAVRAIVHEKASVEEARKIYEDAKGLKARRAAAS